MTLQRAWTYYRYVNGNRHNFLDDVAKCTDALSRVITKNRAKAMFRQLQQIDRRIREGEQI